MPSPLVSASATSPGGSLVAAITTPVGCTTSVPHRPDLLGEGADAEPGRDDQRREDSRRSRGWPERGGEEEQQGQESHGPLVRS